MIHATSFLDIVLAVRGMEGVQKLGSNLQQVKNEIEKLKGERRIFNRDSALRLTQDTIRLKKEIGSLSKDLKTLQFGEGLKKNRLSEIGGEIKKAEQDIKNYQKQQQKLEKGSASFQKTQTSLKRTMTGLFKDRSVGMDPSKMGAFGKKWMHGLYDTKRPELGSRMDAYNRFKEQLHSSDKTERGNAFKNLYGLGNKSLAGQFQNAVRKAIGGARSDYSNTATKKGQLDKEIEKEIASLTAAIQAKKEIIKLNEQEAESIRKNINAKSGVIAETKGALEGRREDLSNLRETRKAKDAEELYKMDTKLDELNEIKRTYEQAKADADDMSRSWASIAYYASKMQQHIAEGLRELKNLQIANVFSRGVTSGLNPYSNPVMGADVSEYGEVAKQLSRSPYAKEFSSNINSLIAYSKIFGEDPNQVIPIASGMQTMLGDRYSTDRILNTMFATSTQSGFGFSGWSSIMMQNTLPQLQTLGVDLKTVASLMGGLSNLGMGPFAAFGMNSISTLAAGGGSDEQKKIMTLLMGQPDAFAKAIEEGGMYHGLEKLGDALDKYDSKKQLQIMTKLFGGMGTGVGSALIQNVEMFKDLEHKMGSLTFGKAQQYSLRQTSSIMFEEFEAATKNMSTSIVDVITSMDSFRAQVKGTTSLFIAIGNGLQKFKNWSQSTQAGKVTSGIGGAALNVTTGYFIGKALGAQLPALYKQMTNALGNQVNDKTLKMYGHIGKSLGILGALYSVATMIHGSMMDYFSKVTENKIQDVSLLEIAMSKSKAGEELTKDEKRVYMEFLRMNPLDKRQREEFDKMMTNRAERELKIKVDVSGTDPINQDAAKTIGKEAGRTINKENLSRQIFQQVEAY